MGVELVEASDLVVRDAVCYMRTTAGLQRVHTIYRRLDDDFIDPLEFRPDSMLGVPGLVRAYRAGTVAIANAIGTGVADDKAIYHYVPEMIRFYLSEEPILDNVPTYLLTDDATRKHVLERLHELVIKPTSESGGKGVFIGPQASAAEREQQARLIEAQPDRFIAQELVHLSTAPTETGDGQLKPRHVDLRPFAVFGEEIRIVPGGLTRVALQEGSMIVNSSQGGGSKDTWVLDDGSVGGSRPGHAAPPPATAAARRPLRRLARPGAAAAAADGPAGCRARSSLMLARIAQELFWLGRDLTRAEHTARMLDGAFHADVAGIPGERGIALSWEGVLAIIGAKPPVHVKDGATAGTAAAVADRAAAVKDGAGAGALATAGHDRGEVARLLTLDTDSPASIVSCVARARERGRTLRDVISTEMWEALNSFYLSLGRYDLQAALLTGPYSVYQEVKERCALFWGLVDRTMLRDEGRAFLEAGGRIEEADMVLRMLRVAVPAEPLPDGTATATPATRARRSRCCRRSAAFRPTAARSARHRASAAVARFLLYDATYPGSVASSVEALRDALVDAPTRSRAPRRRCCGSGG